MSDPTPTPRGRARGRGRGPGMTTPGSVPIASTPTEPLSQMTIGEGLQPTGQPGRSSEQPVSGAPVSSVPGPVEKPEDKEWYKRFLESRDYLRTKPDELTDTKGEGGKNVTLLSNYFNVQIKKQQDWKLQQYRIDISPDSDDLRRRKTIFRKLVDDLPPYIFDGGHMMFSPQVLKVDPFIKKVDYDNRDGSQISYEIIIKRVGELGWNDPGVLQLYNIMVRKSIYSLGLSLIGRYPYDGDLKVDVPQHRLQIWPGYKTSMLPHETMLLLNVEIVNKVVRTETVLQLMHEVKSQARSPNDIRPSIEQLVCNTIVMTIYNQKTYTIESVQWNKRVTDTFETKNGPTSFIDYYKKRFDIDLTDMKQPLLKAKNRNKFENKEILLVPECCRPTGLTEAMKSDFRLMTDLKKHLFVEPTQKVHQLRTFMKKLCDQEALKKDMQDWGLRYNSNNLVEVPGRKLEGEVVVFANGREFIDPQNPSDWTKGFRSEKMFSTIPLSKWGIIVSNRDQGSLDNLIKTIQKVAAPLNYRIANPSRKIIQNVQPRSYITAIEEIMAEFNGKVDLIFIILPNNQPFLYSEVKKKCSVGYGIPSQCFLAKNAQKANMSVCTKVTVQMCAKQGGEPWSIRNPMHKSNLMVVGFDVYHAGGEGVGKKSVGAMVASLNSNLTKYTSVVSMCQRAELSPAMGSKLSQLLEMYKEINGTLPSRIMFYRDGVGEGQLGQVENIEIKSIEKALKPQYALEGLEYPKIFFIVVSKRINTRFMLLNPRVRETDEISCRNPEPGTIVDDVVTLPERFDFFLISPQARQGTVSPTSYNVIRYDSCLKPKHIQLFTYKMCHLYFNWSGTVAVPAVCQYAHKLAFLTGLSLNEPAHSNLANLLHFL